VIGSLTAMRELTGQLNDEDHAHLVTTALDEAERLNRQIQNLLDATRLAQGGMTLNLMAVHMDEVIHSAMQRLPNSDARINTELPANLSPARADRALLEQILVNILENALKYSPAGSMVEVSAEDRAGHVFITVTDHGPGIH